MSDKTDKTEALEWVLDKIAAAKKGPPKLPSVPKPPQFKPTKSPEEKKKELTLKRGQEMELWKTWKQTKDPKDLNPLFDSMKGLIEDRSRRYKNKVEIPTAAIDFEHKQRFVEALDTFNPKKGALSTWVTNYLKKAGRFITTNQNFARIPENIARHIGTFNSVKADLTERLGHEPDSLTLAEELRPHGLTLKDVKRLNKEQRKGLIVSGAPGSDIHPVALLSSREKEVVHLIQHQLTPQERIVHEYSFGLNGKPMLKPGQIAKQLKMDGSKVAKLRTSILKKMNPYLDN